MNAWGTKPQMNERHMNESKKNIWWSLMIKQPHIEIWDHNIHIYFSRYLSIDTSTELVHYNFRRCSELKYFWIADSALYSDCNAAIHRHQIISSMQNELLRPTCSHEHLSLSFVKENHRSSNASVDRSRRFFWGCLLHHFRRCLSTNIETHAFW